MFDCPDVSNKARIASIVVSSSALLLRFICDEFTVSVVGNIIVVSAKLEFIYRKSTVVNAGKDSDVSAVELIPNPSANVSNAGWVLYWGGYLVMNYEL